MSTDNEKRLDDLFKKKLQDPVDEIRYEEGDWDALEQMMDKPRKRGGMIYWLPVLSGAAALLLLFLGWWAFKYRPETTPLKPKSQTIAGRKATDTIMGTKAAAGQKAGDLVNAPKREIRPTAPAETPGTVNAADASGNAGKPNRELAAAKHSRDTIFGKAVQSESISNRANVELTALKPAPVFSTGSIGAPTISRPVVPAYMADVAANPAARGNNKIKLKASAPFRPQFALSVLAAPDLNGVGSFQQSKVGTNIGMMFSAGITKRLTISTGALYSVKPYSTNFNNYHTAYQWQVNPQSVLADCRMLDIPINIGYQVYHRQQNKLSVGTGLSSYLMLHENYKFTYDYGAAAGPTSYTVPNAGKYFFGVVNLNATYERQLNSKMGLTIQPYLKLPLTNIGYSQVKLQTTGVAVGLSWNLNRLSKP